MEAADIAPSPRAQTLADAALAVLGKAGARGLTHRAVDNEAGLPEGSTSNLFRTRGALLSAANARLAEIDAADLRRMADTLAGHDPSPALVARALTGVIVAWSEHSAALSTARFELFLEAGRQPVFAEELDRVRLSFRILAEGFLQQLGCEEPKAHAVPLMVLIDGLVANQLLHASTRLDRDAIELQLVRWLSVC